MTLPHGMTTTLPDGHIQTPYRWERVCCTDPTCPENAAPALAVEGHIPVDPERPRSALEVLYALYNRGSGQEIEFTGPSMSVGDIVTLGETSWRCAPFGWEVHR